MRQRYPVCGDDTNLSLSQDMEVVVGSRCNSSVHFAIGISGLTVGNGQMPLDIQLPSPRPGAASIEINVEDVERPRPELGPSLPRLLMAAIAVVLIVYVAALLVVFEFVYRHLIAVPIAWLLARLGGLSAALRR
jgi:hypothetical protein